MDCPGISRQIKETHMSVIGAILIFVIGMAAGLCAAAGIAVLIKRAVTQLRKERDYLRQSAWKDRLEFETDKAYRVGYHRGYRRGRANPLTDVERLADTIREKNMDFRGPSVRRDDS